MMMMLLLEWMMMMIRSSDDFYEQYCLSMRLQMMEWSVLLVQLLRLMHEFHPRHAATASAL